jgi:dihydrofolate synthase/folylpolyglutamate synthase
MNYKQCLKYLERIQSLGIKFGLDNVSTILASFDNPHKKFDSVLVAGTNGKGSVCAMLTQILTMHRFKVGLFTSPHLIRVEERIRIGRRMIPVKAFCRLLTILRERIEELIASEKLISPPTYFELVTCLSLLYFHERNVDLAVLEVGMGGRFDATNVVKPKVSIITTISGEHQKFLGDTLGQIAFEKAGIIKPEIPVVCGVHGDEAYETIHKRAAKLQAPFYGVFQRKECFNIQKTKFGHSFSYQSEREKYIFSPSLKGEHQGRNASIAIVASELLNKTWKNLEKEKIIKGIENTKWEGRLEVLSRRPLVIMDGAHNEEGVRALKKYIKDFLPSPLVLVFACMKDKDIPKIAGMLFPSAKKIILTQFPFFKAASPEEIREKALRFQDRIVLEPEVEKAMNIAVRSSGLDGCVLITGSLFLAGEVKKLPLKKGTIPF